MRIHALAVVTALRWTPVPLVCGAAMFHTGLAAWIVGAGHPYQRRVEQPVDAVAAALGDLATDGFDSQNGRTGVMAELPQVVANRTPQGFVWQIVKDGSVAVEMTATLTPAKGGAATDVQGLVKLIGGNQAMSAKAFEISFANALDARLAALDAHSGTVLASGGAGLTAAAVLADPLAIARAGMRAQEEEMQLERDAEATRTTDNANRDINFKPGEPMIDVDPAHRRSGP